MATHPFILENVPLRDKNWFETGGPARYYSQPCNDAEYAATLVFARQHGLDVAILGLGANILVSDNEFNGLVIHPNSKELHHTRENEETMVTAGAGITIDELIEYCLQNNLLGLEEFSGIPGSVGGSVYINIHYFEYALSSFLTSARVIDLTTGKIITVDHSWFKFGYDQSCLHDRRHMLISATFRVRPGSVVETAYAKGRSKEIIRHRKSRYPYKGTCGSFFRNFLDHEVTIISNGKKMIYVAYYLDKLGIKGELSHGGARVSYQHANMIVNTGNATSADIIALAKQMQRRVYEQFGVVPQPECQLLGIDRSVFQFH